MIGNIKERFKEIERLIFAYKDIATREERAELIRFLKFEIGLLKTEHKFNQAIYSREVYSREVLK
jgi:hypothetical protein